MEKPKIYLLKRYQASSNKPFLKLLGVNVLREILKFLENKDFTEFCITCMKFYKF